MLYLVILCKKECLYTKIFINYKKHFKVKKYGSIEFYFKDCIYIKK